MSIKKLNLCFVLLLSFLLTGCSKSNNNSPQVNAVVFIEAGNEALSNVLVSLPKEMHRDIISDVQHDFICDGKQVGGIVIVDISNELLDSPYGDNLLKITGILGEQLMSQKNPDDIEFMCAGGNDFAYMEIYTGGKKISYAHFLFRGETNNYDVWFAYDLVDEETIADIISTISADDITAELNKSIM